AVVVGDGLDVAATGLGLTRVVEDVVVRLDRTDVGVGVTRVRRVVDLLEVVAFDQDTTAHGGGHAVLGVVPVVVVEHVHRVSVSHARVTGVGAVEVVVVVGRPQMSFVLGVPVAVPDQRRLVVVEEVVPGDRHVVGQIGRAHVCTPVTF